uniref:Uncharacterized protein LOC101510873 n=1 Tax=Cicer arietinum TaxID=3827 RepID=A0A1S3E0A4_CICAR|nr:uncharacterized protein LOC101510873 [Cicer arietinum]XP_027188317.1 uncharacterized protein LOC101510873 [Cicer arietinum]
MEGQYLSYGLNLQGVALVVEFMVRETCPLTFDRGVSLTQHSQNPSNSMTGMSLEAERAARIRAEQIAQDAVAQAQLATKVAEEARERSKKLENDFDALKQFFGDKFDALHRQSTGGSSTASHPPSHPHYDQNLDDVSLDEA